MDVLDLSDKGLSEALRTIAAVLESRQQGGLHSGFRHRRLAATERLLEGKDADPAILDYNLDCIHVGIAVAGPQPTRPLRDLRRKLSSRLFFVEPIEEIAWIWLGGSRRLADDSLKLLLQWEWPAHSAVGYGEPAAGLEGWRLTHRQALAALRIAQQGSDRVIDYRSVALLAAALQDDLLSSSLRQSYLVPLEADKDGGLIAKETLRAYFGAARNASSAAAALGVNRGTVSKRLETIENRLGQSLDLVSAELEVALRLDEVAVSNVMGGQPSKASTLIRRNI